MKKYIVALMVLGLTFALVISSNSNADTTRTIAHKFRTFTANTDVSQSAVIYRITGVTTAANGVFGVYNVATAAAGSTSNCAIEGGEGTAGDALPHYDFGEDGLALDTGMSVIVSNCYVTIEYI
jgi:hypothetical protein